MKKEIKQPDLPKSYEDAVAELEEIIAGMESGEMPLQSSINAYKRGFALLEYCQKQLSAVEEQVKTFQA